ncbi:MAG: aconitase X [Enterocloster aldenensis]
MKVLYALGEYYGPENFLEILACHDNSTVYSGETQVAFAEHLADTGAKFTVQTSTNTCALYMACWDIEKHEPFWMSATQHLIRPDYQLPSGPR